MRTHSVAALLTVLVSATMPAATIGQIDTFQDGTTDGWFAGGITGNVPPAPPVVVLTGGPTGAGDAYLKITGNGSMGAGGKIVAINATQWTGNFLAPGIQGIRLDLLNLGNTALTVRLLIEDPMMGPPADEAVSNVGINLPAGSGWTHGFIPLSASAFTAIAGSTSAALSNATFFRIIDAPVPGDAVPVVGVLGVDNITLVGVPEPSAVLLLAGGLGVMAFRRLRHQRRT